MKKIFLATMVAGFATMAQSEPVFTTVSDLNKLSTLAPTVSPRPAQRPKNFDAEAALQQTLKKMALDYGCKTLADICRSPS